MRDSLWAIPPSTTLHRCKMSRKANDLRAAVARLDEACRAVAQGRRAARAMASWARPHGLSEAGFRLLWRLLCCVEQTPLEDCPPYHNTPTDANHESLDQITLAAELALSASQISALVDQLGRSGWIRAVTTTGDRRRQLWQLTPRGQAQMETLVVLGTSLTWPSEDGTLTGWNAITAQGDAA